MSERFSMKYDGVIITEKDNKVIPSFENNLGRIFENIKSQNALYSPREFNEVLGSMLYAACDNKSGDSGKEEKTAENETADDSVDEKLDVNKSKRPNPEASEDKAKDIYGGDAQKSYKNGKEVPYGTPGSSRPDLVAEDPETGNLIAIEVKNYDLSNENNIKSLCEKLKDQVEARNNNMPEGTEQKIILDLRGQDLTEEQIDEVVIEIKDSLSDVYDDIPVEIIKD